ncbi:MAG: tyrosine-type recombinase/integrase [Elusimicrobiota bacterium]|nr:tyrosine-type recombinase/integrase [Elusimicrobiota bacterium]
MIENYKSWRLKTVKPATVNRELACLKNMYNRAIDWDLTSINPIRKVKLFHESPGRVRFLSKDEISRLLAQSSGYLRDILITALNTGMRLGEIPGLKWNDIDLENGVIHIPSSSSKNKFAREIPINSMLMRTLINLREIAKSEYVFCDENGQ